MEIKLFVCCHKPCMVPKHPLLVPIQVGAALAAQRFPDMLHDDVGENISAKNRSYCELTAQYWAWKNVDADYYGFFHYRRYLYPDLREKLPYTIKGKPSLTLLDQSGYSNFAELIAQYDLIAPKREDMHISVREHYASAKFHHCKDLDLAADIVCQKHPEMTGTVKDYLSGTAHYFGNIYIMRRNVFVDYCAWLFSLLEQFDASTDTSGYNEQERRLDGYVAERLFGIYLTYWRDTLETLELPRMHFYENTGAYLRNKAINAFLPPGTVRRKRVKNIMCR